MQTNISLVKGEFIVGRMGLKISHWMIRKMEIVKVKAILEWWMKQVGGIDLIQ